jgi:predicted nucleotidyltransferase
MLVSIVCFVSAGALYTIVQGAALGIAEGLRVGLRNRVVACLGDARIAGVRREVEYRPRVLSAAAINEAGRQLAEAAAAPAQVFLFGSHARGDATDDSDLDFLVVERDTEPTAGEWVRLRDALPPLGVPVDVIVMSDDLVRRRRDVPGSLVYTAMREGRLVAES